MKRVFHPGDEWLYLKLYMGPETTDAFIAEVMEPFVNWLDTVNPVRNWFYIRYMDPMFHIRLRFRLRNNRDMGLLVEKLRDISKDFYSNGLIWKTEISTYEREIERYGNYWIEAAENLFEIDSRFWISIIPSLRKISGGEEIRWQSAMLSAHSLFSDFGLSVSERIDLLAKMTDSFMVEFGGSKRLRLQLDHKLRENRELIEEIMSNPGRAGIEQLKPALGSRSRENIKAISGGAVLLENNGILKQSSIADIIHMSLNRGLRSKHRMQELVIYYFLKKTYISRMAREAKS